MEFLQLKYFQAVARLEHMTKAAQELKVSQPSLSNTISRLEKSLGVPLFVRQGRHIKLTSFGKSFLQRVDRVFLELEEGVREVKEMASLERGVVSLAITMPSILPYLLKDFLAVHPHSRIIQNQAYTVHDIKSQLENAEINLCISTFPVISSEIEWLPLMDEEIFLSVPPQHHLADRKSINLSQVANEPFISITSDYGFRDLTDNFCRQAGFEPNIVFQISEAGVIQNLVELDLGITFTPSLLSSHSKLGSIQLHIDEPLCQRTIGLAWHKRHFMSQATEQFIQFAIDFFKKKKQILFEMIS